MFDHLTIEWLKASGIFLGLASIGWLWALCKASAMSSDMERRLEDMRIERGIGSRRR